LHSGRDKLRRCLTVTVLLGLPLFAQPRGAALTCGSCHTAQARSQPETSMAHALLLPGANTVLAAHPKLAFRHGAYSYTVETQNGQSTYSVTDGMRTISVPIQWAFGTGSQTWVFERDGVFYESYVSYYPMANGLDITIGDQGMEPTTLDQAFGRELTNAEITACFGCHATNAVSDYHVHFDSLKPGVTCERCHTGAAAHREAISHGKLESVPPKLKRLSAEQISNFCGECHRSFEEVPRNHWLGTMNVRFQPYRLANSKCFNGADARISCLACHDPHQQVVTDRASYDPKCLACHATTAHLPPVSNSSHVGRSCPVATSSCVSCHMPKVKLPGGHQEFTDHYIRVVHPDDPYPN
jgi:hypothetical protein